MMKKSIKMCEFKTRLHHMWSCFHKHDIMHQNWAAIGLVLLPWVDSHPVLEHCGMFLLEYRKITFTGRYVTKPAFGSNTFNLRRTHKPVTIVTRERDDVTEFGRRPIAPTVYWKARVRARYRCQVDKMSHYVLNPYFHSIPFKPNAEMIIGNLNPPPRKARAWFFLYSQYHNRWCPWRQKEPEHQRAWCWPSVAELFPSQYQKD